ncbi:hypothetical protein [uncultured Aquimarina sp.]|uniref:hypothetical protein n=1 Tax=uncultured Aquimarina sp. TaxID=575652 RepID=UPI002627A3C3|nr:hypothetical protein [uncultured Aquimarina sp.]
MTQKLIFFSFLFIFSCKQEPKINQIEKPKVENEKKVEEILNGNKKCDIKKVVSLKNELPNASKKSIETFLSTVSVDCKNNVEFSQFSNEVLFEVLYSKPMDVISIMEKENIIDKNEIYRMLENPINDVVNLKKMIDNINKLEVQNTNKTIILEALQKALDKY